jgi:hypothetical protein
MTRAETDTGLCPVCGIDQDKARHDLSQTERRVRRAARSIRFAAMLHLILTGVLILQLPEAEQRFGLGVVAVINLILAIGLIHYDYRAYRFAVVCYFGFGIVQTIAVNLIGIPLALVLIYVVGNRTAKAIFERRASEA